MKAIVVINDLRPVPLLAALKIARSIVSTEAVELVASTRLVSHRDFGDYAPRIFKALTFSFLRIFGNLKAIPANPDTSITDVETMGIESSLYSIANNSGANSASYPRMHQSLVALSKGAKEVIAYLDSQVVARLYLFNGRTASSYPLSKYSHARGLTTLYYEYAVDCTGFKLYPCPPHASGELGFALMKFYREAAVSLPSMVDGAQLFEKEKINNPYAALSVCEPTKNYDVAMFLGSDHEYTAVDPAICGIEWRGNIDFCRRVIAKYGAGKTYAIRCHPNQRNDGNWRVLLDGLTQFSRASGADLYGPDSHISSHDLIRKSTVVATDLSSIAIDAVLLGKDVDVFGGTDLQKILHNMPQQLRANPFARKKIVAEMFGLSAKLFLIQFNWLETAICRVFTKVNAIFAKVNSTRAFN